LLSLPNLNLPPIQPQLQEVSGKVQIFDFLRKKYLILTPEEWVRQHWINFLINFQGYPKGLISLEKGLKYNQIQKRTDLVVFDKNGSPYLLIECKAPEIELDTKVLSQALAYQTTLLCPFVVLSNGLNHVFMEYSLLNKKFTQTTNFPPIP
jgi:type I site-specific restriction endonuclease